MSTAERIYRNLMDLRAGRVTPDEARAVNRAIRAEVGDDAYDAAKIAAVTFDVRRNG